MRSSAVMGSRESEVGGVGSTTVEDGWARQKTEKNELTSGAHTASTRDFLGTRSALRGFLVEERVSVGPEKWDTG